MSAAGRGHDVWNVMPGGDRSRIDFEGLTDREVMTAVQTGEPRALNELVRRFWKPLVSYAYRLLGDIDDSEDVAQETFARVWQRRADWQPTGSVGAFLYVITRRLALNESRRLRRRLRLLRRSELEDDRSWEPTPFDHLQNEELRAAVDAAIAALAPRQREIFILARYHRLSHAEIAETLGISRATVSNHMTSALRRLREELASFVEKR